MGEIMRDEQLTAKPFNLDGAAVAWVRETLARLTPDEKIRQLFNLRLRGNDTVRYGPARDFRPGGITVTPSADWAAHRSTPLRRRRCWCRRISKAAA
jgi:hypothetical protein